MNYTVRYVFDDGTYHYVFPYVQDVNDSKEGDKHIQIEGNRADGSLYIPGGKKSQTISISGILADADGFKDLAALMNIMRTQVTTDQATLTCKYYDPTLSGGGGWVNNWSYTVRRVGEISFSKQSFRTFTQEYSANFLVLVY